MHDVRGDPVIAPRGTCDLDHRLLTKVVASGIKLRRMRFGPLLLPPWLRIALIIFCATARAEGPIYDSKDGCDESRWKEWDSIIIGFDGDPIEQTDAIEMRNFNRALCGRMKSGELTQDQADEIYSRELDEWVERVEQRQRRNETPAGNPTMG